ncbi:hypothetical protein [Vibrio parahaemolyticus]|uniref:hypothetical protein n=1 Tax=Vibrio parahaemolyticus TaxID=670 RepID=UPI00111F261B|nr:hypothetical protein [Vibrio parahaemolyticus]TOJ94517.1 hypothetical protein CGI27_24390 [Vibrio parahaemolyticus]
MSLCKYCKKNEAIENSHIIPSFICKWVKDTAHNNYLRTSDNPNLRQQDGSKSALLCNDCEVKFSKFEDDFKKSVFTKVANYRKPCPDVISFSENSLKCIHSIAWRVLADTYYFPRDNQYTDKEFSEFPNFLDDIRAVIDENVENEFSIQFIPCLKEVIKSTDLPRVDFSFYDRAFGAEPRIWDDWLRFNVFIKIPFAIIVFELVKYEHDRWSGTRIDKTFKLHVNEVTQAPKFLTAEINYFYSQYLNGLSSVSDSQRALMIEDAAKFGKDCGSFKSMRKTWD